MVINITTLDQCYNFKCQDGLKRSSSNNAINNNNNNSNSNWQNNCFNSRSMVFVKSTQEPPANSNNCGGSSSSDSCLLTRVTFKVDTPLGDLPANQVVAIIGDSSEIGNWNVKGSIELQVTEQNDTHLIWTTTIIFPTSTKINYKYIVVNKSRSPSLLVEWEAAKGSSRTITVEGKEMFVNDGIFGVLGSASQPWIGRGWLPDNETQLRVQLQVDENPVKLYSKEFSETSLILRIHDPYGLSQDFQLPLSNYSELVLHAPSVDQLGFSASIITVNQNGASSPGGGSPGDLIGRVFVISSQINSKWGKISVPILSEKGIIGEFRCNFIVVLPFVHPLNSLSVLWHSFVEHPNSLIGHRGNGKNNFGINTSAVTENTILSFLTAARFGAKMIEFDLQLTFDNVPVIFHNYEIDIETSEGVVMQETINRLTLEQFLKLKPQKKVDQLSNAISHMKKHRLSRSTGDLYSLSDKDSFNSILSTTTQPYVIHDRYSTFQEAFTFVPHDVGFMVEIKYPNLLMQNLRKFSAPERNEFVDIILNIVFNEAGERRIAFLTFDPDIAILLRTKQFRYPVLFLVCSDTPNFYSVFDPDVNVNDSRGNSILNAVSFVKTVNLDGIVCDSESILQNHSFVQTVHQENLLLFTYGSKNVDTKNIKIQNDLGVDGIITDNLTKLSKKLREENSIVSAGLV